MQLPISHQYQHRSYLSPLPRHSHSVYSLIQIASMLFSVRIDGKVSKCEAIFCLPQMENKNMQTLFSVHANRSLCAPSAIFCPQWRKI